MNRSPINLQMFRNANKTSLLLLGVASMVFAAPPRGKETELMPLPSDAAGRDDREGVIVARLQPLPETYRVVEHYSGRYGGRTRGTRVGEEKIIYSNTNGQFLFSPGRGLRIADDLITELFAPCTLNTVRVRVTGGVEDGDGFFLADLSLFDGCPGSGEGGTEIPGTRVRFSGLEDNAGQFHDLILDFTDRGICDDESSCEVSQQNCADQSVCVENPLEIPPTVWIRMRFDTDEAAVVAGAPPTIGFSADGYDDPQLSCTAWFAGWPRFPHASLWVELTAPEQCATHFLAYLAANYDKPQIGGDPPFPGLSTATRVGDDIHLSVDNCVLSAFEVGMKGTVGPFEMSIDLRWPSILDVIPETVQSFWGRGEGSVEVAHFRIPPEIELNIGRLDQPIYMTWWPDRTNTLVLKVGVTQIGESGPEYFALGSDPNNPKTWNTIFEPGSSPGVFYAAVYCRGEADSDGDGVLDDCDACLDSDLSKLIAVEECPTGVPNQLLDDGCTMNDVLGECLVGAHSHGELTACVARHANEWRRQGLLSGKDVGRIAHCAGTSNEGRPSKRSKYLRSRGSQ